MSKILKYLTHRVIESVDDSGNTTDRMLSPLIFCSSSWMAPKWAILIIFSNESIDVKMRVMRNINRKV